MNAPGEVRLHKSVPHGSRILISWTSPVRYRADDYGFHSAGLSASPGHAHSEVFRCHRTFKVYAVNRVERSGAMRDGKGEGTVSATSTPFA